MPTLWDESGSEKGSAPVSSRKRCLRRALAISFLGMTALAGLAGLAGLSGCASTNPRPAFDDVRERVRSRAGHAPEWPRDPEHDRAVRTLVHELLAEPLDVDAAVRIALLSNRSLLADFEEIGISQAELAQASRIENPTFYGSVRFAKDAPNDNPEIGFALNFLDVFILPLKKKVARAELERVKLRVAYEVIRLAAEVKAAFYELLAAEEFLERLKLKEEIRSAAAEFAERQERAGNLSELDLAQHRALYNQIRVDVLKAELGVRAIREALNRHLGLWGEEIQWRSQGGLPPLPGTDPVLESVETLALENRFDVAAARKGVDQVARAVALTKATRFFPAGVTIGIESEREPDGVRVSGPTLALKLPVFDQGQPALARLQSQLLQSQRRLEDLSIRVRSEVRQARDFMIAARALTEYYRDRLLPDRRDIVALTLEQYNMMFQSTYDLLAAREREVETERAYIESWRDYWIARTELERALGGSFAQKEERR